MTSHRTEQRWVLALASLGPFLVVLDMLLVATALTTIHHDLGAPIEDLEWTVNAYTLTFAIFLMSAATLGDRYGRRGGYAVGLALFGAASAACALSANVGTLIAARAVQGIGAAAVMPLALSLLNTAFPPQQRGRAMGVYGSITGLAAAMGPVVGGAVTQGLAWQWIFWIKGRARPRRAGRRASAAAMGIAPLIVAPRAGLWADRIGERPLVVTGLALQAAGLAWMALIASPTVGYLALAVPMSVTGVGFSLCLPALTKAVVSSVAVTDIGKASGAFSTMRQLGGAFGVAILGLAFAGDGQYASAAAFSDGYSRAMLIAAAIALAGAITGARLPTRTTATLAEHTSQPGDAG